MQQPKVLKTVQDIVQSWGEGDAQVVSQVVPQMYGYTCGQVADELLDCAVASLGQRAKLLFVAFSISYIL